MSKRSWLFLALCIILLLMILVLNRPFGMNEGADLNASASLKVTDEIFGWPISSMTAFWATSRSNALTADAFFTSEIRPPPNYPTSFSP